jgi:hypothetical protein
MALPTHLSGAATPEDEQSQVPKLTEQDLTHLFVSNHIWQPVPVFHRRVMAGNVDNFLLTFGWLYMCSQPKSPWRIIEKLSE